jgi:serine/threonine protein phosphatase PrpC
MGRHPDQSRLLQSLGGEDPPRPRHGSAEVAPGDGFLLCSDGFWEHQSREEIGALAAHPPGERQRALDHAAAEAVRRAGKKADNTTAVLVVFDPKPRTEQKPATRARDRGAGTDRRPEKTNRHREPKKAGPARGDKVLLWILAAVIGFFLGLLLLEIAKRG